MATSNSTHQRYMQHLDENHNVIATLALISCDTFSADQMSVKFAYTPPATGPTCSFNLLVYTSTVKKWMEELTTPTRENIDEALLWLDSLKTGGSSCLLEAFKTALLSGAEGIYLVTDGQADHTHEFLLNQLHRLKKQFGKTWTLNTIAFHCENE